MGQPRSLGYLLGLKQQRWQKVMMAHLTFNTALRVQIAYMTL